jgi:phosphoribosylaminoimidazolecarboxamide formyltransferase/IMP cyclohydrolase
MSEDKPKKKQPKKIDRRMYSTKVEAEGFAHAFILGDDVAIAKDDVRYGQNPHQAAIRFINLHQDGPSLMTAEWRYAGKKGLSFINITDTNSAMKLCDLLGDADTAVVVPVKHSTPSGIGLDYSNNMVRAYELAFKGDPKAIFGCSMAVNRPVGEDFMRALGELNLEVLTAPSFTENAVEYVKAHKPGTRLLELGEGKVSFPKYNIVAVSGGYVMEEAHETRILGPENLETLTEAKPTDEHIRAGLAAWKIAGNVKSNAIVIVSPDGTHVYGIGAGQMSRVEAARLAIFNSRTLYGEGELAGKSLEGAVAASDAFFPFPDGPELLAKAGIGAVVYPLGSIRDGDTRKLLNEYNVVGLVPRPEPGNNITERAFSGHP